MNINKHIINMRKINALGILRILSSSRITVLKKMMKHQCNKYQKVFVEIVKNIWHKNVNIQDNRQKINVIKARAN